jgi:hypothetical protein
MFRPRVFKRNTKTKTKNLKDTKGDWEFSAYQKKFIPNEEQNIKKEMCPENSFNPKLIPEYINPNSSKEIIILQKSKDGETLNKSEKIILENYLEKKDLVIKKELDNIEKFGLSIKPTTNEGRVLILLMSLEKVLLKNNNDMVCNIYLRLQEDGMVISEGDKKKYNKILTKMNAIIEKTDLTEFQFTKFHNQMPPLNIKGFKKFDPWQIDVIHNIDNNIATIIEAPTSAGKTVLAGYATTKGKTLLIMPTDALVWQVAAYTGGILDLDVPIVTPTWKTIPRRDELIIKLNSSPVIVGTADSIVDILPLLDIKFDWIILDEIHMIGKKEGCAMEHILKLFPTVPFLALSATIGNIKEITNWLSQINPNREVKNIVCNENFFNKQRFNFNSDNDNLEMLHPLSMTKLEDFTPDLKLLKKNLQPTPPATWNLYKKLKEHYGDLKELNHEKYFESKERIHLSKATKYFYNLVEYMITNYNEEKITLIINSYKNIAQNDSRPSIVKLVFKMKELNKIPAIIFQKNTNATLRITREFAKSIEQMEDEKFPRLRSDREKAMKKARRIEKKEEKEEDKASRKIEGDSKKDQRKFLEDNKKSETNGEDSINVEALQKPTEDFTFTDQQYFSETVIDDIAKQLKKYFPSYGTEYHFMIKLLWRGVGVFAYGLPDPYLRTVQRLASDKKLAIVFSDMSLVFGVSMPFRSSVIYKDNLIEDDLDPMLYHQMAGRAGRRGLDTEGNVIFCGYKWSRIEELSISPIPNIIGMNTINMVVPHAQKLAEIFKNNQNWENIFRNPLIGNEEENLEILEGIKSNYENGWNFAISSDKNHLHMMWKLRNTPNSDEPIIISFLIPYIKRGFEGLSPVLEANQVFIAHFLSHFINISTTDNQEHILPECSIFEQESFKSIYNILEELQLDIPKNIDGLVFKSIKDNKLVKMKSESSYDKLRHRLMTFGNIIMEIQHFCFHNKFTNLARLIAKLLTRIFWIYHDSSPIMKKLHIFDDQNEFKEVEEIERHETDSEAENDEDDDDESQTDETISEEITIIKKSD